VSLHTPDRYRIGSTSHPKRTPPHARVQLFNAMMAKVPVLIKMGRKRLPDDPQRQQPSSPHVTAAVTDVKTINPPLPYFETVWDKNKVDNLVGSICLSMVTASRDEDRDRILDHVAQHFDDFKVEETIRNALWVRCCSALPVFAGKGSAV
jgi:hypothetical protein